MSTTTIADIESHIRQVTDDEVREYEEQGWVSLPGLLSTELAGEMLARLKQTTGIDHDELPRDHPEA